MQAAPSGMDPAPEGMTFPIDVNEGDGTLLNRKMIPQIVPDGDPVRYRVGNIARFRILNCVENVGMIRWFSGHDYKDPPKTLDTNGNCTQRYRFISPGHQEIRASYQLWTDSGRRITTEQNVRPYPIEVADRPWYKKKKWQAALGVVAIAATEGALRQSGRSLFSW